jgi:hypothetical protein
MPKPSNGRARLNDDETATAAAREVTVVLTGSTLALEQVIVARAGVAVELEPGAIERMRRARAVTDPALAPGGVLGPGSLPAGSTAPR